MTDIRRTHGSGNQMRCYRDDHAPWQEIQAARAAAHEKHGANSIEVLPADSDQWLRVLVEEVGEVARATTYDNGDRGQLRAELIDVLAVAAAWLAAVDAEPGEADGTFECEGGCGRKFLPHPEDDQDNPASRVCATCAAMEAGRG